MTSQEGKESPWKMRCRWKGKWMEAYFHAVWTKSCYTLIPASFFHFAAHSCGLQSTFCKQLKNSAIPTENHTCQSAPPPRLKTQHTLTWDFFAITLMPYNYSLKNVAWVTFSPAPCKNDCTAKRWWMPLMWLIKAKVKQSPAANDSLIITTGSRNSYWANV